MSNEINQISASKFLQHYVQNASYLMWFLGAGTSRSAGLPTAIDIIWDLKRRYYCRHENQDLQLHDINNNAIKHKIQTYMDSRGFPARWSPEEYSFYFDLMFGNDYQAQQQYIHEALSSDKISLNIGHRILAGLMAMGKARIVYTTNFDEVIENAFAEVTSKNLSTYHLEGSYAALDALNKDIYPLYAKIHGDFRYRSIKNLPEDLQNNDREIQKCFLAATTRYGLVVSGYSGRDRNVMTMFREAINQNNAFPYGLFWATPKTTSVEDGVWELIADAKKKSVDAHVIEIGTFDEMLSKIWRQVEGKPQALDNKIRTARATNFSIPLPAPGKQYPILRTNALPVLMLPLRCGMVELNDSITFGDIKKKIIEISPNAVLTYTDKILFWGNSKEIVKLLAANKVRTIKSYDIEEGLKLTSESTIIRAFFEEALATALCQSKPLFLRRSKDKTYYAVVKNLAANDKLFSRMRNELGDITGNVPELKDVTWAESASIHLEERGGNLWVMLRPDIWIKPLSKRQEARSFLRQRCLKRYNKQSYQLLDMWIEILLGKVGSGDTVNVSCFQDTEYSAEFKIGTRTAYSRKCGHER
ncbi:SIR2 family protein [Nitrosomonas communis]|uniref:SIR2 family protein n=1 Tax=Nitrosomonas communis TaxID=44574 RepID=UPI0026ECAB33|nr:SIR2 family protein [Nitrosomonas communis]MCO6427911.1 SIR2 family protein [Nitrosomonas communis]